MAPKRYHDFRSPCRCLVWIQGEAEIATGLTHSQHLISYQTAQLAEFDIHIDHHLDADVPKRDAVREAFQWSWDAYERYAWGDDECHPLSHGGSNLTLAGGVGYTIIDSLDSLLVMGFDDEYARAREWVQDSLSFDKDAEFNTFEVGALSDNTQANSRQPFVSSVVSSRLITSRTTNFT